MNPKFKTDPVFAALARLDKAYKKEKRLFDMGNVFDAQSSKLAEGEAKEAIKTRDKFARENPGHKFWDTREEFFRTLRYQARQNGEAKRLGARANKLYKRGSAIETSAVVAFAKTVPTTPGGALAMIEWIQQRVETGDEIATYWLHKGQPVYLLMFKSLKKFLEHRSRKDATINN